MQLSFLKASFLLNVSSSKLLNNNFKLWRSIVEIANAQQNKVSPWFRIFFETFEFNRVECIFWTLVNRARGTDFVRLCPASASVRFLEIFPVRRPNSSLRRTIGLRPPSAFVRFQIFFSVLRDEGFVRLRPLSTIFYRSLVHLRP